MTSTMRMSLKAGEKIYINGAVLQVDRKVSLQFLNNATFLLGAHVLQVEAATTPLRQLYFVTQTLLIDPAGEGDALALFCHFGSALRKAFVSSKIVCELEEIDGLVKGGNTYAALKRIRDLYPLEAEVIASGVRLPALTLTNQGEADDGDNTPALRNGSNAGPAISQLGSSR